MARRGMVGALLGSGLVAITALGGAGGYGVGVVTAAERVVSATGTAAPLGRVEPSSPGTSATPTPSVPTRTIRRDTSPPLTADKLKYKTRAFTVKSVVKSRVTARVPADWRGTQPDPPRTARFTDPTGKRWVRIEAGFSIRRAPTESMAARVAQLRAIPADQMISITSQTVDPDTGNATLVYTYVPDDSVRYVIVRWVANEAGLCTFEIASTGLPQDRAALEDVLQHASDSAVRTDSEI